MKVKVILMSLLLGLGFPVIASSMRVSTSQNATVDVSKMSSKERKAYEKRQKEIKDSIDHVQAVESIKSGNFIMLVERRDSIEMKTAGEKRINVLIVENNKDVLFQSGVENSTTGNNNMGGVTVDTEITKIGKIEEKKNGEVKCRYDIMGIYLAGRINLKLNKKDNYAEIGITNNKDGAFYDLSGVILPYDKNGIAREIKIGRKFVPDGSGKVKGTKGNNDHLSNYINFGEINDKNN